MKASRSSRRHCRHALSSGWIGMVKKPSFIWDSEDGGRTIEGREPEKEETIVTWISEVRHLPRLSVVCRLSSVVCHLSSVVYHPHRINRRLAAEHPRHVGSAFGLQLFERLDRIEGGVRRQDQVVAPE